MRMALPLSLYSCAYLMISFAIFFSSSTDVMMILFFAWMRLSYLDIARGFTVKKAAQGLRETRRCCHCHYMQLHEILQRSCS